MAKKGMLMKEGNRIHKAIEILKKEGLKSFVRKSSAYILKRLMFLASYILFKIKCLNQNCNLNKSLDFTFNKYAGLIKPVQVHSEILELLKILDRIKPKVILEMGTAKGGTLFLFSHIAHKNAIIISIDLPGRKLGSGYPIWRKSLYKSFALTGQKIYLLRADSHKAETLEEVKNILHGREVDFLFIDGDHTYEGVKADFEMYSPLVRKRGIIALHDIVPGPSENVGGVPGFWSKIKIFADSKEIVEDRDQGGYGIGVIYV